MKLFEAHFETQDGEQEYTQKMYVVAPDIDAAIRYFVDMLETWFGEETVVTERESGTLDGMVKRVENDWGTLAAKIDYLAPINQFGVETTDGEYKIVRFEVQDHNA